MKHASSIFTTKLSPTLSQGSIRTFRNRLRIGLIVQIGGESIVSGTKAGLSMRYCPVDQKMEFECRLRLTMCAVQARIS